MIDEPYSETYMDEDGKVSFVGIKSITQTGGNAMGMGDLNTNLEIIHNDVKETRDSVRNIYKILNGNGKIGLVTQVKLNTDYIAEKKQIRDTHWGWIVAFIIALIASIPTWLDWINTMSAGG